MAERWFLEIDGVPGESLDDRHRGEIEIDAWSWGVSTASGIVGTLSRRGKPRFDEFRFEARLSAASPALLRAVATGERIDSATLTGVRDGEPSGVDVLTYELTDVGVGSVEQGDSGPTVPSERFTLRYGAVTVTYRPQTATGAAGTPVTFTYDVRSGTAT